MTTTLPKFQDSGTRYAYGYGYLSSMLCRIEEEVAQARAEGREINPNTVSEVIDNFKRMDDHLHAEDSQ